MVLKTKSYASPFSMLLFSIGVLFLIYYSLPTDEELSGYYINDLSPTKALEVLKRLFEKRPSNPLVLRRLAEAEESNGDPDQAIRYMEQLLHLRPRNPSYWEKYLQILDHAAYPVKRLRAKEKMIQLKVIKPTSNNLLEIAHEFEWRQLPEDAIRIYRQMLRMGFLNSLQIEQLVRLFFRLRDPEPVERLIIQQINRRRLPKEAFQTLSAAYAQYGNPDKANEMLALFAGVRPDISILIRNDARAILGFDAATIVRHIGLFGQVMSEHFDNKRLEPGFIIFDRLLEFNLIKKLDYISAMYLAHENQEDNSKKSIHQMALYFIDHFKIELDDWNFLIDFFDSPENQEFSQGILEDLILNRNPKDRFKEKLLQRTKRQSSVFTNHPLLADLHDFQALLILAQRNKPHLKDQLTYEQKLKSYQRLLGIYDGKKDQEKTLEYLNQFLKELGSQRDSDSQKLFRRVEEDLLERHYWRSEHQAILDRVENKDPKTLSPKSRILSNLALESLEYTDELVVNLDGKNLDDSKELDDDYKKILQELQQRVSDYEKNRVIQRREIYFRNIIDEYFEDRVILKNDLLSTTGTFAQGLGIEAKFRPRGSRWIYGATAENFYFNPDRSQSGRFLAGIGTNNQGWLLTLKGGVNSGSNFIRPTGNLNIGANKLGFDYISLNVSLFVPKKESTPLVTQSLSHHEAQIYFEKRWTDWVQLTGSLGQEILHRGRRNGIGSGTRGSLYLPIGPAQERWRAGPWTELVRRKFDDADLVSILSTKSTSVGGFVQYAAPFWDPTHTRLHAKAAMGLDLSSNAEDNKIGLFELFFDSRWSSNWAFRAAYAGFVSSVTTTNPSLSHSLSTQLAWRIPK